MALIAVATPGPTTLLAMNNGARWGVRAALPGVVGAMLSDLVLIAAVGLGLGGVLSIGSWAFEVLRWIGVAYLAWLGWLLVRDAGRTDAIDGAHADDRRDRPRRILWRSFSVAVTNPKGYLFFSALLPSFIRPDASLLPQYFLLALVFTSIDGIVVLGYAAAGSTGVRRLGHPNTKRRLAQASGCALLVMATGLALWRREGS